MMLRYCSFLLALLVLAGCASPQFIRPNEYDRTIRIACVGDSITFGAGVEEREVNAYPVVLQKCLGPKFETRNFGVSGATLLKQGDGSYWKLGQFTDVGTYQPDVIILKLGTNDSKPQNWKHKDQFADDLRAMLDHFAALPSHPKIWVCLPVPVYQDRWGINEATVKGEVIPLIRQVAKEKNVPVIDLHAAMSGRPECFPDGVHPNKVGALFLAQAVCYELLEHK